MRIDGCIFERVSVFEEKAGVEAPNPAKIDAIRR
jgi:hypothetical protein